VCLPEGKWRDIISPLAVFYDFSLRYVVGDVWVAMIQFVNNFITFRPFHDFVVSENCCSNIHCRHSVPCNFGEISVEFVIVGTPFLFSALR
jgi:hypothetical protein